MPQLLVLEGTYFSATDEEHFFAWLKSIPGVRRVNGTSRGLSVTLASAPSQPALRELLALHWRYRLPMKELARFRTARNEAWFADPKAYWYNAVFGRQAVSPDIEARLRELHNAGQTPVQAIKALHAEYGFSLAEAKRRFSLSAAWAAEQKASEPLQREAIRVLRRQESAA